MAQTENRRTETPLLRDDDGRLIVTVMIDGKGPFDFIIDTAATRTALFEKTSLALGIDVNDTTLATVITPFGIEQMPVTAPLRLEVAGGRTLPDMRAVVLPDWSPDFAPGGFLGLDFLSNYFLVFDLEMNVFEAYERNPVNTTRDWIAIDLKEERFGDLDAPLYWTHIRVGRRRFYAVLDTGSVSTVLNWPAALRMGFSANSRDFQGGSMQDALGNERPIVGIRFPRVRVGDRLWRKEVLLVADMKIFEALGRKEVPTGILGLSLLTQQNFAVDFKEPRLYISPQHLRRVPDPNNRRTDY
jgi:predicted aspartyl protease